MFSFLLLMIALNVAKHPIFNLVDNNKTVSSLLQLCFLAAGIIYSIYLNCVFLNYCNYIAYFQDLLIWLCQLGFNEPGIFFSFCKERNRFGERVLSIKERTS